MRDDGTAKYADFHVGADGKIVLFSLMTGDEHGVHTMWDVEWSKTFGYYLFHMSGAGRFEPEASGVYWAAEGVKVKERPSAFIQAAARKRNPTKRLPEVPDEFEGMDLLEWLNNNGVNEDAIYCSICRDHLPGTELCEHCWWCDEGGWYSAPSERMPLCKDEHCGCVHKKKKRGSK